MISIFWQSVETVLVLFIMGAAGFLLAKKEILDFETRHKLSAVLMYVFLPSLIVAQLMPAAAQSNWKTLWILPVMAFFNLALGMLLGAITAFAARKKELIRPAMAAMAFTNTGYIPISLIVALSFSSLCCCPEHGDMRGVGTGLVALYLVVFSPLLWVIGYNLLAFSSLREMQLKKCVTPPLVTAFVTLILAFTPLHKLFITPNAPLQFVFSAASMFGDATAPCALLLLGANLASASDREKIPADFLMHFSFAKYVMAPLLSLFLLVILVKAGVEVTYLTALIIILEGCMPPGLNLIIICQNTRKHLPFMTSLLFWNYIIALPFLIIWLFAAFYILNNTNLIN